MKNKNKPSRHPRGSFLAVTLAMLGVMMYYSINLTITYLKTLKSIATMQNLRRADTGVSNAHSYMRFTINKTEAGYLEKALCESDDFIGVERGNAAYDALPEYCKMVFRNYAKATPDFFEKNRLATRIEIKGRADESFEYFDSGNCGNFEANGTTKKCFTVPIPGTGNAGENCNIYRPFPNDQPSSADTLINHAGKPKTGNEPAVRQLDYPCNWNQLKFGSSLTGRIAIPLYYTYFDEQGEIVVVNPFHEDTPANLRANEFALRIRTQCRPFEQRGDNGASMPNTGIKDPTVCNYQHRYNLTEYDFFDNLKTKPLVQWQITGFCEDDNGGEQPCSLIANSQDYESINEQKIKNSELDAIKIEDKRDEGYTVLEKFSYGLDTNKPVSSGLKFILEKYEVFDPEEVVLSKMNKPVLTLYLNGKLIADDEFDPTFGKKQLNFLEYQFLTDAPVGVPITKALAIFNFEGNVKMREKNFYQEVELVDFAIKN